MVEEDGRPSERDDDDMRRFEELLDRSSLGTAGARQLRRRTPRADIKTVRRISQLRSRMVNTTADDAAFDNAAAAAAELIAYLTELGYHEQAEAVLNEWFPHDDPALHILTGTGTTTIRRSRSWSGTRLISVIQARASIQRGVRQRLATAADALASAEINTVPCVAVLEAARLFGADEAEIVMTDPPRVVRGDVEEIHYDGLPAGAPPSSGHVVSVELPSPDGEAALGDLRLLAHDQEIVLSDQEVSMLVTFAGLLGAAIVNAETLIKTRRLADGHTRPGADPLTGLATRRQFVEHAGQQLLTGGANGVTALVLIDLDHFAEINYTLGHAAGDQVLVEVAGRLSASARPDELVARFGSDEFAILLTGQPTYTLAVSRAHTLLAALTPSMDVEGVQVSIQACAGVVVADNDAGRNDAVTEMVKLLRHADMAMDHAKEVGSRLVTFDEAVNMMAAGLNPGFERRVQDPLHHPLRRIVRDDTADHVGDAESADALNADLRGRDHA